ncbi:substrate-binding periplasmic protein [Piscinibacter sp.]|jgi:polar amino acid transport system substrate-binding protein|uniref:substrate-binding periplasmic protein n=1 Tax=Piscinibacter sp. TaxID=1903157 RepID=UPI002F409B83
MRTDRESPAPRFIAGAALALALLAPGARAQTMTFVMDPFPPFTYEEGGKAAGPMSDTIRAVCDELKWQCALEVYPWRRALKMAEEGLVDGIYAIADIPERRQFFYVTPTIIESAYAVFAHRSSPLTYTRASDLDGYTVGAYGPSAASKAAETIAQSAPTVKLVIEVDNTTLLRKLSGMRYGERGVAVANVDVGRQLIRQESIPDLKVAGVVSKIEYCIGLSRKKVSERQAEEFTATLRRLMKAGKVKQIADKYGVVSPAH